LASEAEILRIALLAYEAAAEPGLWSRVLELYNNAVSSDSAVLQIHDLHSKRSNIVAGFGIGSPLTQSYNEHYSKLNIWRNRGEALYVPGNVNVDPEFCPRSVLERSEFYNDYLLRIGAAYCMGAVISRSEGQAPTLSALRGRRKGEFGEVERKIAKTLLPHLCRAWKIHQNLDLLAAGESVMDTLPLGVVFLSGGGRAIYWNRAAETMFRANDGLSIQEGALSARDSNADAQLHEAIDSALQPLRSTSGPAAVSIPRSATSRDYQIVAAPLRAPRFQQFVGTAMPLAVVLITDPERKRLTGSELLIHIYKLTPKEAMLSTKIAEGKSIRKAADELSITYETARTHLRRVFGKTGTSRQAELVMLINQLPATGTNQNG
jgi:DNA-binding CsgD family transcriptional regulator